MASASSESSKISNNAPKPMLGFLPAGIIRTIAEVLLTSIPGAILQAFFIVAVAGINIWVSGDWAMALGYLPVVCLLPLIVGTVSTLVYERVRGTHSAHVKGSVLCSAMAGFIGSAIGALAIILAAFVLKAKPMGVAVTDPVMIAGVSVLIVILSTLLSALGALLVVGVLNKMEK